MNFLAHLYLSPKDNNILIGNFIADAVKGKAIERFNEDIKKGIYLHRDIDTYTDSHPIFKKSCDKLRPNYRKYSGVIVDIYYDHFLCKNWQDYSDIPLKDFVSSTYYLLLRNYAQLPKLSKRILPWMMIQNWLANYHDLSALRRVFGGMSRRTTNNSGMEKAVNDLLLNYEIYEEEFKMFFPEIIEYVNNHKYYKI